MATKAYPFGEWTPDLAGNILTKAVNVRAVANGYAPIKSPQIAVPTYGTAQQFLGGGSFIGSNGTSYLIAARPDRLQEYTGGAWSLISDVGSTQPWRFAQFGDHVIMSSGNSGSKLLAFDLIAGTTAVISTSPTNAVDVAQVRDFVMCITDDNKVQWSQFNDALTWTTGTNQADYQPILSSQGVRLVGGEYGILLKKQGITRMTYVGVEGGLEIVFQFDEISAEVGCMAAGSVCNIGRLIFFLSERGFEMCDGNEVKPIADEKFNRWFFKTYSREEIQNIWAAIDPRNSLVMWAMPGNPGRIIAYNWVLNKATTVELDVQGIFTGYSAATGLDALDAIYGDLDSIPVSLDDPSLQGGNPLLLVVNNNGDLTALTGDNLQAMFRLENIEPTPGRRSRIRDVRLVTDANDASVTIDARMRVGDDESVVAASSMRSNGKMPIRSNGRYNTLSVTIPEATDWSFIQGLELEYEAGDGR